MKCTTFEALLKPLTSKLLEESIKRFDADYYSKSFKTRDHLIAMIYAQLHDIKSLRDLEVAFNSQKKSNILGGVQINRSTLSDANHKRPSRCFLWMLEQLMSLLPRKKRKEVNKIVRKMDSSPIQLKGKGYDEWTLANRTLRCQGLKLHVEYDGQLDVPVRTELSSANIDDCSMGQKWPILTDTIYVFDKGYYDFNWWWKIDQEQSFFVTRLKRNAAIVKTQKIPIIDNDQILEDDLFIFKNKSQRGGKKNLYKKPLRRVVVNREGKTPLVIVTNLLEVSALVIAELYRERWGIELFFKWVKQNLRIKKFLGKSENAVKTQIAIALIVYVLISIFKLTLNHTLSLHQLLVWIRHNWVEKKNNYNFIKPPDYCFPTTSVSLNMPGGKL